MKVKVAIAIGLATAALGIGTVYGTKESDAREFASPTAAERQSAVDQVVDTARRALSPGAQLEAIADGDVSREEYYLSTDAELACIRKALPASNVDGPFPKSGGPLLDYTVQFEGQGPADASQSIKDCWNRERKYASAVYSLQLIPVGDERQALEAAGRECLAGAGLARDDSLSFPELVGQGLSAAKADDDQQHAVEECLNKSFILSIAPDPTVAD